MTCGGKRGKLNTALNLDQLGPLVSNKGVISKGLDTTSSTKIEEVCTATNSVHCIIILIVSKYLITPHLKLHPQVTYICVRLDTKE